jgi:hypothetical protein
MNMIAYSRKVRSNGTGRMNVARIIPETIESMNPNPNPEHVTKNSLICFGEPAVLR